MTFDDALKIYTRCDINAALDENLNECFLYNADYKYGTSYPTLYVYDDEVNKRRSVPLKHLVFRLYTGLSTPKRSHMFTICNHANCANFLHYRFAKGALIQVLRTVSGDIDLISRQTVIPYVPKAFTDSSLVPLPAYLLYRFYAIGSHPTPPPTGNATEDFLAMLRPDQRG